MDVTSFRVTGDWRHVVDDGMVDQDALPDEALPTGWVQFTPVGPAVAVAGGPSTAYTVAPVRALIAGGRLTDLQGREGMWLAGKIGAHTVRWRAVTHLEYHREKIEYPSLSFDLGSDVRLTGLIQNTEPGQPPIVLDPRIEELAAYVSHVRDQVEVADASADASAASATQSGVAADRSATEANRSKAEADRSKVQADASATSASTAGGKAESAASQAGASAQSAFAADVSAKAAKVSETNSKSSETNSKASETNAAGSAGTAQTEANRSKAEADRSKAQADLAAGSQLAAKTSESNAKASESAASGSASAAAGSATAAEAARPKWKGAYSSGSAYAQSDLVSYQGGSWYATAAAAAGTAPPSAPWQQVAAKGADGSSGATTWDAISGKPTDLVQKSTDLGTTSTKAKPDQIADGLIYLTGQMDSKADKSAVVANGGGVGTALKMTQAAYNALSSKDANTVYYIQG